MDLAFKKKHNKSNKNSWHTGHLNIERAVQLGRPAIVGGKGGAFLRKPLDFNRFNEKKRFKTLRSTEKTLGFLWLDIWHLIHEEFEGWWDLRNLTKNLWFHNPGWDPPIASWGGGQRGRSNDISLRVGDGRHLGSSIQHSTCEVHSRILFSKSKNLTVRVGWKTHPGRAVRCADNFVD